jgi:uncharacterized membrane protein SirB2
VADPSNPQGVKDTLRPVPELPPRLVAMFPMVIIGTLLWFAGFLVLLAYDLVTGTTPGVWLWTTVAGVVISCIGLGIMTWQRAAARRGSRGAQTGL